MSQTLASASPTSRIGLFGGTFDPVHQGHLHLAKLSREALELDEVRFIPCQISPHKTGRSPAPAKDRLEMLRLATREIPWAVVDPFEIDSPAPSYSVLTARETASREPGSRLFWIMGADQWQALTSWNEPDALAALVEFIVLARDGHTPAPRAGYRLLIVRGEHPASASTIRASLADPSANPPWLDPDVARWIRERGLYTSPPVNPR